MTMDAEQELAELRLAHEQLIASYNEACHALGEAIAQNRLLSREVHGHRERASEQEVARQVAAAVESERAPTDVGP